MFKDDERCVFSRIGDYGINLKQLALSGYFNELFNFDAVKVFSSSTLNEFMAKGPSAWKKTRQSLQAIIHDWEKIPGELLNQIFIQVEKLSPCLPAKIGDYTDFYASKEHATNVGIMFRGKENALMPNWYYHDISSCNTLFGQDSHAHWVSWKGIFNSGFTVTGQASSRAN